MSQEQEHPVVSMACRRGSDQLTAGQTCKSKKAFKLSGDGAKVTSYRCQNCGFAWDVNVGGALQIQDAVQPPVPEAERKEVHMACRRGSDRLTAGQKCKSRLAFKLSPDGARTSSFQCAECGFGWNVPVGGAFTAC